MPRPDISEQRIKQILDATESCIAKYGLEGASLESIANEAGVKRSIIRHYIGNREALLVALTKRSISNSIATLEQVADRLPRRKRAKVLMDYLFMRDPNSSKDATVAMDTIVAMAEHHPECRELLRGFIESLLTIVREQLMICYPKASVKRCWSVANGVMAMVFVFESLDPLGLPTRYEKSWKQNAMMLVNTLDEK